MFAFSTVASEAANNAEIVVSGSSVPGSMTPGSTASVRIRVRNNGTTTWSAGALYRLGATGANGITWQGFPCGGYAVSPTNARVFLCNNVPPGGTYDFNFQIAAPSSSGTYQMGVRMVRDGVEWFGQSHTFTISVSGGGGSANNAVIDAAGSSVPGSMIAGSTAAVRIRVHNTGTTTWSAGALYRLGAAGNNQFTWQGFPCGGYMNSVTNGRVFLCNNVPPDGFYDFNFKIRAPSSSGTFPMAVRMVRDGVEWFGQTFTWNVVVSGATGLPDVVVDSVSVIPANPTNGQAVSFQSVVRNAGSAATPNGVVIGVGYRVDGSQKTWGVVNGPLQPGASVTIGTQGGTWTATTGTHTLTAVVDDVNRFPESNENNNARSVNFNVSGGGGICPPGTYDIADYALGDNPSLRVYVKNTRGQTETFAYLPGVSVAGVQQHFFVKNDSGENWEEFGVDSNYLYRYRDTSWTDRCTNPDAEAYYEVVDDNRVSFAKWAPRCMSVGQSWTSDVGSQVKAHFERINNCAECDSQYEGSTRQRMTLAKHHPTYRTIWGVNIPDVIELYTASSNDRFFYAKAYGLVGFEGPDPAGGQFVMGAEQIDPGGHNPPNRVPLCGNDTPPGFQGFSGLQPLVNYCFNEKTVAVQGIAPNDVRPGVYDGRLQGDALAVADLAGHRPGAVRLDGETGNVQVEGSEALGLRRGVQVEALVYRQSNTTEDGIAGRWYGDDQWLLTFYPEGAGKLVFTVRLEDGSYQSVSYRLPDRKYLRTWVHVAAGYDIQRGLRLYWNGARVAAARSRGKRLAPTSKPIHVGDSGNTWSRFHGRIDEVKISAPSASSPQPILRSPSENLVR